MDNDSIAVVAPIRYGAYAEARRLLAQGRAAAGPQVYLTGAEAIFVFAGAGARAAADALVSDSSASPTALAWRRCLAGRPRLAEDVERH